MTSPARTRREDRRQATAGPGPLVSVDALHPLLDDGNAQLIEVLPAEEYGWAHLPDAVHVPLGDIGRIVPPAVDHTRPVITYCNDFL